MTISGHKALQHDEPLLFEQGCDTLSGVDLPDLPASFTPTVGNLAPRQTIGLPGLSEPQVVRHYTRLSQLNFAIDAGFYPLGSCTMKHNPRLNEKMARLKGLGELHPLQPLSTVQGALALMQELAYRLGSTGLVPEAQLPSSRITAKMADLLNTAKLPRHGQTPVGARSRAMLLESG